MNRALLASGKHDWRTPPEVLAPIEAFAGRIALDPCSGPDSIVRARVSIAPPEDGLAVDWRRRAKGGLIFCNPPYSEVAAWAKKASEEARHRAEIVLLVPARTDTRWWQESIAPHADAVCFWKGRIRFLGGKDSAPFPTAVVYFGDRAKSFWRQLCAHGWVVRL